MNGLLLPVDGCPRCVTEYAHPYRVERGSRVCWAPGRFYPFTSEDAEVLTAVAVTGYAEPPGIKTLWQVTLMPACSDHAPAGTRPAWVVAGQAQPCEHVEPGDGIIALYGCHRCGHSWWASWDSSAIGLPCPGCDLCERFGGAA